MIAVDGVYSMDGDCAPLSELSLLAADHDALLMVDDAHGFGVLGADGRGSAAHWGLGEEALPVLMGTLGKSLGTFGAFVAGSEALIETLIQRARTYIYTTALPPAVAAATRVSLRLLREEGWRRDHLAVLRERLQAGLRALPWPVSASITPIQPILIGSPELALDLSRRLLEEGFYVPAIRPPTVPVGTARLRVTLSAAHSVDDVDQLLVARQCP
jgi:8-amino-7-oxononanoate synthase